MFRYTVHAVDPASGNESPFMGCQSRGPLLDWLFRPGVWCPRVTADQAEAELDRAGAATVVFDDGFGSERQAVWEVRDNEFNDAPTVEWTAEEVLRAEG